MDSVNPTIGSRVLGNILRWLTVAAVLLLVGACDDPAEREQSFMDSAKSLYEAGDHDKARLDFRNALQINPNNVDARYHVALIDEQKGDLQAALGIPASTLSHHISRLLRVGLVTQERQSRTLICRANFEESNALTGFLCDNCCQGLNIVVQAASDAA